ncbi:unnamed protein product [Orchesella dallaii]|uniref:Uncharacterized protein n=1 Tax=Orchesella dallaii TaxID=48710 RepID=A0ABP1QFY8_9HEXA
MAILNKLIKLPILVFILSNLYESFGMQCYHCSFFEQTRIKDNYKMVAGNKKLHFPSDYHSSCAQGQDPANSLIVDCTMEYYEILTKTFRDHPDPESPLALRCIHCNYFAPLDSTKQLPNFTVDDQGPGYSRQIPFVSDPSCAFGMIPDPSLSIDCSIHPHIVAAVLSGYAKELQEFELKLEDLLDTNDTRRMTYSCAAMVFHEKIYVKGTAQKIQTTFRSCYPSDRNITEDMLTYKFLFSAYNATGYLCDDDDNCNAKGDKMESATGEMTVADFSLVFIMGFMVFLGNFVTLANVF